jgi:hypothetical protein
MDDKGGEESRGYGRDADWLLQFLVKAGEGLQSGEKPIQVTVLVGGQMMSGDVIAPREYLKAIGVPEDVRAEFNRAYLEVEHLPPNYLHLKNVKVIQPGSKFTQPTSLTGVPLRVRLSAVDGFTLGSFSEPT